MHNKCFIHIQLYPRQKSICQNVSHLMKHPIICDNEQIMKKMTKEKSEAQYSKYNFIL